MKSEVISLLGPIRISALQNEAKGRAGERWNANVNQSR